MLLGNEAAVSGFVSFATLYGSLIFISENVIRIFPLIYMQIKFETILECISISFIGPLCHLFMKMIHLSFKLSCPTSP